MELDWLKCDLSKTIMSEGAFSHKLAQNNT